MWTISTCAIIFSSVLYSKKLFQEVQPMGGVGCRPSGRPEGEGYTHPGGGTSRSWVVGGGGINLHRKSYIH
jgi:hypothetical protein